MLTNQSHITGQSILHAVSCHHDRIVGGFSATCAISAYHH